MRKYRGCGSSGAMEIGTRNCSPLELVLDERQYLLSNDMMAAFSRSLDEANLVVGRIRLRPPSLWAEPRGADLRRFSGSHGPHARWCAAADRDPLAEEPQRTAAVSHRPHSVWRALEGDRRPRDAGGRPR